MGMSSSQARLLSLTSRMHDIEYKAQKLEAQKLQMANESAHVYSEYENALNNSKIQFRTLNSDGSFDYSDATLAGLENGIISSYNGTKSSNTYFLRNNDTNEIYVTKEMAEYLGVDNKEVPVLDKILADLKCSKVKSVADKSKIENLALASNTVTGTPRWVDTSYSLQGTLSAVNETNLTYNYVPATSNTMSVLTNTKVELSGPYEPDNSGISQDKYVSTAEDLVNALNGLYTIVLTADIDMSNVNYTPTGTKNGCVIIGNGHTISGLTTSLFNNLSGTNEINDLVIISSADNIIATTKTGDNLSLKNCFIVAEGENQSLVGSVANGSNVNLNKTYSSEEIIVAPGKGNVPTTTSDNTTITLTSAPNLSEIKNMLTYEMWNASDKTKDISAYTTKVNSYSNDALLNIAYNICGQNAETVATVIASLNKGETKYTTGLVIPQNFNSYNDSSYTYETKHTGTIALPNKEDIITAIAYGVDPSNRELTATRLNGLSDKEIASLASYKDNQTSWNEIITLVKNNNISQLKSKYAGKYSTDAYSQVTFEYAPNSALSIKETEAHYEKATVNVPSNDAVKNNLVYSLKEQGIEYTDEAINSLLQGKSGLDLANLNDAIVKAKGNNEKLLAVLNGSIPEVYTSDKYQAQTSTATCSFNYGTKTEVVTADKTDWASLGTAWNENDPLWSQGVLEYNLKMETLSDVEKLGLKFVTIEDTQLVNSKEFVSNIVNNGGSFLAFSGSLLTMRDANVATETNLQEIIDDVDLKKAEAKYEADMRRINAKDKKYDTDLAALDNERNAIKTEMETLKTVAKENVERTFKLFG